MALQPSENLGVLGRPLAKEASQLLTVQPRRRSDLDHLALLDVHASMHRGRPRPLRARGLLKAWGSGDKARAQWHCLSPSRLETLPDPGISWPSNQPGTSLWWSCRRLSPTGRWSRRARSEASGRLHSGRLWTRHDPTSLTHPANESIAGVAAVAVVRGLDPRGWAQAMTNPHQLRVMTFVMGAARFASRVQRNSCSYLS